uniref:40S ribosomal protein S2 n=1 Tax=Rhizophora mucronata TaxID=61149 RepID=A0A2P2ISM7_RHIMU
MWLPDLVPRIPSPHRNHRQLSQHDRAAYGGGDFLGTLDPQSDGAIPVADDNKGLEPGSLAGSGLLLDRRNFHDLVLEGGAD